MRKIAEDTVISLSIVLVLLSGAWAASKLDSRIDTEKMRNDKQESQLDSLGRIERRLYKIEIKTGVDKPEPLQGE